VVLRATLIAAVAAATLAGPALADRAPTPEERTAIEAKLTALGFVAWDEIELDDGTWEVDDARTADGQEYDLDLAPGTLEVIRQDPD
jgi:hypothetical protein